MGGPFKLQFANNFIIYQKRPFRGRFGPGRFHSELWAWGVKYQFALLRHLQRDQPAVTAIWHMAHESRPISIAVGQ